MSVNTSLLNIEKMICKHSPCTVKALCLSRVDVLQNAFAETKNIYPLCTIATDTRNDIAHIVITP